MVELLHDGNFLLDEVDGISSAFRSGRVPTRITMQGRVEVTGGCKMPLFWLALGLAKDVRLSSLAQSRLGEFLDRLDKALASEMPQLDAVESNLTYSLPY